ncbi:MAG: isoleucine--tRNA ligase [Candidatus Woesearchaeota archaeon]
MKRNYDFKEIEKKVLKLWKEHKEDIDAAIKDENIENLPRFTFLEGPPTANAPPGLHHVEARVFKDLFTRFKQMQGYKVSRKGGWDCHGLPVEVQVEKKLGLESKKDVIKYGVDEFIAECKKDVFTYIDAWTKSTEKLAFWVDLDEPYVTLNTTYMESVWWALKQIYEKNLLYQGHKVVPYCARCGTPLSSHEVALGYQDIEETTVVSKFTAKDKNYFMEKGVAKEGKPVIFLAWTTTPWTLPSNLALAVHPEVEYAFVDEEEAVYVLAENLVSKYFEEGASIIGTLKGQELTGQIYEPLFEYFKEKAPNSFRIIPADYVTTEDGTGIVHQAPAYGEDDNIACSKHGIDFVNPVDENGEFTEEVPDFQGRFVKDADKDILEFLEKKGLVFSTAPYVHSYPFCWRCKTPLIYYAKDTWFIAVTKVKEQLITENEKINWHPHTIKKGRFGNWLEGARDWALSRNKFWGTPLPLWVCDNEECDHKEAIGSIEELKEKTGTEVDDLHISTVDPLTYTCEKCGSTMRRTPEVIDTWFDSGSAPFAQLHYPFENKELFNDMYPYSFIAEGIDQTRGWFYTMLVINTILFGKTPYKNVAVAGLLCDENGDKMSKSKGNIIQPDEVFDAHGVDAVRMVMCSYTLGEAIKFGPSIFKEQIDPFFRTLWNTYYYIRSYLERFELKGDEVNDASKLEDEWMLSKTNSMIADVTDHLEKHQYNHAVNTLIDFANNTLSRTYIKLIRDRANSKDEELGFVMRYAFDSLVRAMAPFTPYASEQLYQEFLKRDGAWSVHFNGYPKPDYRNEDLEKEFDQAQSVIQGVLAAREKAQFGVRWPLKEAYVLTTQVEKLNDRINELIKEQTNVREIKFVKDFPVELSFEIDYRKLGEEFGTETGDVIPEVKKNMDMITKALNESDTVVVGKWTLTKDHFKVEKVVPEPYKMAPFNLGEVYLDTTMTPELEREGFSREVTRRIQQLRKKAGLEKDDEVKLAIETIDLEKAVKEHSDEIKRKVGATEMYLNEKKEFEHSKQESVKGKDFTISLEKS